MLIVRTKLRQSGIHGLGVFADEPIKKGQKIWEMHEEWCSMFTKQEKARLPKIAQDFLDIYAYESSHYLGKIILGIDNDRFMNHSDAPNTDFSHPTDGFAIKDIAAGEEITCNYKEFCVDYALI